MLRVWFERRNDDERYVETNVENIKSVKRIACIGVQGAFVADWRDPAGGKRRDGSARAAFEGRRRRIGRSNRIEPAERGKVLAVASADVRQQCKRGKRRWTHYFYYHAECAPPYDFRVTPYFKSGSGAGGSIGGPRVRSYGVHGELRRLRLRLNKERPKWVRDTTLRGRRGDRITCFRLPAPRTEKIRFRVVARASGHDGNAYETTNASGRRRPIRQSCRPWSRASLKY